MRLVVEVEDIEALLEEEAADAAETALFVLFFVSAVPEAFESSVIDATEHLLAAAAEDLLFLMLLAADLNAAELELEEDDITSCLLYTSPSPRDRG